MRLCYSNCRRLSLGTLLGLLMVSLSGCSNQPSDGAVLAPVRGVVTIDGKPQESIKVLFEPQSNFGPSWGKTNSEGEFELFYSRTHQGAVVGSHRVQFQRIDGAPPEGASQPVKPIPRQYALGSAGFAVEVSEGTENDFSFELSDKQ